MRAADLWSWMAGSVRGASHIGSDMPRQDHYWVGSFDGHRTVAVVMCDGAGGVSRGGAGAALAVRILRGLVRAELAADWGMPSPEALAAWLGIARIALERIALVHGLPVDALATTAMIAVSDGLTTTTAHIGDGFIAAQLAEGDAWQCLSAPQRGEYAGTTSFISDDLANPITSVLARPILRLCLSTDGLEPVAWDDARHEPHAPFLTGVAKAITIPEGRDAGACARLRAWLTSSELQTRVHDDLTVCMAARVGM